MQKQTLRRQMLNQRRIMGRAEWLSSSNAAQRNLLAREEYAAAVCIALYSAVQNETATDYIFTNAIRAGKQVLYPAITDHGMILRQLKSLDDLQPGMYGIPEPPVYADEIEPAVPGLIVVPGVAFDSTGQRLGYGKGYYDRYLRGLTPAPVLIGLCHDFQLLGDLIPTERHDIQMNIIITDRRSEICIEK